MKTTIITTIKTILADRTMTVLLAVLILAVLAYSMYVILSLRPSDLQVAVHYSAFGETSFYRDKWYYLINFVAFGVLVAVAYTAIAAKIYIQGRRDLAIAFVVLGLLLIAIAWFIARAVLRIAFL